MALSKDGANSAAALSDLFDWLSPSQVYRIIQKMIELGILEKGNYNKKGYDRTSWFAFTDSFCEIAKSRLQYCKFHFTKSQIPFYEIAKWILRNRNTYTRS